MWCCTTGSLQKLLETSFFLQIVEKYFKYSLAFDYISGVFPVQRDCKLHGAGPPDGLGAGGVLGGDGEGRTDQAGHEAQPRAVWYQHHLIRVICLVFAVVEVWMDA